MNMQKSSGAVVDRKLVAVLIIVCVVLAGSFALVYLDLKADFESLKNSSANLASEVGQLQGLIQDLHANQTNGLTAVQIYNRTMFSVVLITNQLADGSTAEGTGFVYDSQGDIVTNNHVVDGAASITVTFFDGSVQTAQLKGNDVYSDLALIKVNKLPVQSEPLLSRN